MLETIKSINDVVNGLVWGVPAMVCIIGVGILMSVRTKFIQFRKFPYAMKATLGKIFKKSEAGQGSITPFQAVCTALAATVGTGNIAGVAGAIAIGGPGAVFWMWISALLGMCTKFAEVTLAVHFRERNEHGDYVGGPMYYIKNGLSKKWHFLAVLYVILGIGVIILNADRVPSVFYSIFYGAFNPSAITGGVVGSLFVSMQKGVSRGIFSNEAGLGTGSIAHATADTTDPVEQGVFGIFEVFADTIVICTLTALTILCSGVPVEFGAAAGAELTISGFTATYGSWVSIFTAVAMCCFAFSTILGWGLYGARCMEFLGSAKFIKPFMILYSLMGVVGATMDLGLLWSIADTFNGLMAIPNLIALFLLSGTVVKLVKEKF